jgi:hypothetical protein
VSDQRAPRLCPSDQREPRAPGQQALEEPPAQGASWVPMAQQKVRGPPAEQPKGDAEVGILAGAAGQRFARTRCWKAWWRRPGR